jgi:hypothetical protein
LRCQEDGWAALPAKLSDEDVEDVIAAVLRVLRT